MSRRVRIVAWSTLALALIVAPLALVLQRFRNQPRPTPSEAPRSLVRIAGPTTRPEEERPQVWAVTVGIQDYEDAAIPDCQGTIRDSLDIARWITEKAGWDSSHVLRMTDSGRRGDPRTDVPEENLRPTRDHLKWALTTWLGSNRVRRGRGDVVLIYYAGQAATRPSQGRTRPAREFLLPIDARARDLDQTGWTPEEALDRLAGELGCTVLVWLDTATQGRGRPVPDTDPDPEGGTRLLNRLTRWPGASAWLAADGAPAPDGPDPSPFARALLAGLGDRPANLLACLDQLQRNDTLKGQHFRALGGLAPALTLWEADLLPVGKPRPRIFLQQGHADAINALAFRADGEELATASQDSTIRIWQVGQGRRRLVRALAENTIGVTAMDLSPDGRRLAAGDGAGRVLFWDLDDPRRNDRERDLPLEFDRGQPHRARLRSLTFLPDGRHLASIDDDGRAFLWDSRGRVLAVAPLNAGPLREAASARDPKTPLALAAVGADGRVVLFDAEGHPLATHSGPGGERVVLGLAADGRRLALGDETGSVLLLDLADPKVRKVARRTEFKEPIHALRFDARGRLAVASGTRLFLADPGKDGPGRALEGLSGPVETITFSGSENWLAAATAHGAMALWDLSRPERPTRVDLPGLGAASGARCLAFSADGRRLAAGEGDGGFRLWGLERPADQIDEPIHFRAHRGQVRRVALGLGGRRLLQIDGDGRARVWDLVDGRDSRLLPGRWRAGAFVPRPKDAGAGAGVDAPDEWIALARHEDLGGLPIVLYDPRTGESRPTTFEPPTIAGRDRPTEVRFGRVVAAPSGRWIAATPLGDFRPLVCIWDATKGGAPRVIPFRSKSAEITGLAVAPDGGHLLTADSEGEAILWKVAADGTPAAEPAGRVPNQARAPIVAASLAPEGPPRVALARWQAGRPSQVELWGWERAGGPATLGPRPLVTREVRDRVAALGVGGSGRWLAAAGQDRRLHLWDLEGGRPEEVKVEPERPESHHSEQVLDLVAWPGKPLVATGGDDTTVRLWAPEPRANHWRLLQTLAAALAPPTDDRRAPIGEAEGWVTFTPDGHFDSNREGGQLVTFLMNREVRPLDQFDEQLHVFRLTDRVLRGEPLEVKPFEPPARLVIDPPAKPETQAREAELTISMSGPLEVKDLRLYQNGVPVPIAARPAAAGVPQRVVAPVRLRSGPNTFYAMAGRPGDVDARSDDVRLTYLGPEPPGRVHVVALGVGGYADPNFSLAFAVPDAQDFSAFLRRPDTPAEPGLKIVLEDRKVNARAIDREFERLQEAVRGRPEDTVVLFLAGHAEVLSVAGRDRFSLLLPRYPFPAIPEPNRRPGPAGGEVLALRGREGIAVADPPTGSFYLFADLFRKLSQLDALNRLVVIDACQAGAILDDPAVRLITQRIGKAVETDARPVKTSYLLAARRGELTGESSTLGHGLLTYVLLRGMGAPDVPEPEKVGPVFRANPTADDNGDGVVTTAELSLYADRVLPALKRLEPALVSRAGAPAPAGQVAPNPDRRVLLQTAEFSFPLIRLEAPGRVVGD